MVWTNLYIQKPRIVTNDSICKQFGLRPLENFYLQYTLWQIETQLKWFLDEKRDGLVDENRKKNQQNENQQTVYTPKKSFCRSNLFQTINNQLIYTYFSPEYSFQLRKGWVFLIEMCQFYDEVVTVC